MRGRHQVLLASCAAGAIVALMMPYVHNPLVRIVYNPSDSVPRGWYRVTEPGAPHVGDYVIAALPRDAAALAAQRHYLPQHVPILKRIGAVSPQQVCVIDGLVYVDDVPVANVLRADALGRPLPVWQQCRRLVGSELFLLSVTNPASFDSRYFGPVATSSVIGKALPQWTWSTP